MRKVNFPLSVVLLVLTFVSVEIASGSYSNDSLTSYYDIRENVFPVDMPKRVKSERGFVHRRTKRYLAFPEGASFTCAVCATVGVIGSPYYSYLSYGLNWGVAYDLPNETWVLNHLHGSRNYPEPTAILKRRQRRSIYKAIETFVGSMGYNGRDCILRALCESRQFFPAEKLGMIPELLRNLFSLPKTRLFTREIQESSDIQLYNNAYFSEEDEDCEMKYPCSFSLLELAMGKYSEPPDYYGDQ